MADRRLQVFYTVAKLMSFTKAAEALHMTQPAVTFQVRQLEEHYNTRLFDRSHNRISLTDVGSEVFAYSAKIFALYDEMDSTVREMTGNVSGVLLLGARKGDFDCSELSSSWCMMMRASDRSSFWSYLRSRFWSNLEFTLLSLRWLAIWMA